MNEKVSVLMSIYKEPLDWIETSVESILNQTYKNIQVVLISDNPESVELTQYLKKVQEKDKRVLVIINEKNIGLVRSLNHGLKFCIGEYIARMDADDISFKNRIESQLNYIRETGYDFVGCQYRTFEGDEDISESNVPNSAEACSKVVRYKSCVAHPSWLVKKQVFEVLDGYRNIDACEDLDFLQRALINGFKIGNVPQVLLRYRNNQNSISHKKEYRQQAIRRCMVKSLYHNKIVSEEEYQKYISSQQYDSDVKKLEKISQKEYLFKHCEKKGKKIIALLSLLKEPIFIEEKIWNRIINRAIKSDKERDKWKV